MEEVDVCPTEDAVRTFLEHLVDPLLPARISGLSAPAPTPTLQEEVGKQVHAVVLLYNYYHRIQHPQLEFLWFVSFCKLAVVLKPPLLPYLEFTQKSDVSEVKDPEMQLSVSERMIMDACNICENLDAVKGSSNIQNWPITKVAVLLVDSEKKSCLLEYESVTHGAWSVIESNFDAANQCSRGTTGYKRRRITNKRDNSSESEDDSVYKQLAFAAVKKETGITEAHLKLLESHVTYSHSKEKAAARFYIIQCLKLTDNTVMQVPISKMIKSLQGPLLKKVSRRWVVSPVVEYFHLLPYARIISDWFSRELSSDSLQDKRIELLKENTNISKTEQKSCDPGPHLNGGLGMVVNKETGSFNNELPEGKNDDGHSTTSLQCASDVAQCMDIDHLVSDNNGKSVEKVDKIENHPKTESPAQDKGLNCGSPFEAKVKVGSSCVPSNLFSEDNDNKSRTDQTSVVDHASNRARDQIAEKHKSSPDNYALIPHGACSDKPENVSHTIAFENVSHTIASKDKELSQAALKVLLRKKDKLRMQMRSIEDGVACCDKNIQTILNGGKDALAIKIDTVIEGCNSICISNCHENLFQSRDDQPLPQYLRETLSDTVPKMKNPCQELDAVCTANNWILPTYHVTATSDGGFRATVTLKNTEFECSTNSDVKGSPEEARASAAIKLFSEFRRITTLSP